MEIKGKFKEDFENWLKLNWSDKYLISATGDDFCDLVTHFKKIPFSMQYGVYVDFADSKGYVISIEYDIYTNDFVAYINEEPTHPLYHWEERLEARKSAINKLIEIYNGQ